MLNHKKIQALGFDIVGAAFFSSCIQFLLKDTDFITANRINTAKMDSIYLKITYPQYALKDGITFSEEEELYYIQTLNTLKNYCQKWQHEQFPKIDYDFVLQCIRSLKANYRLYKNNPSVEYDYEKLITDHNIRDIQMADNIIWYLDRHPQAKLLIWCANLHGAQDISMIQYPNYSSYHNRLKLMGEYLAEKYGDQLYSLAFTFANHPAYSAPEGYLEQEIASRNIEFGFIDFQPLRYKDDFFNREFKANFWWPKPGKWMHAFDGVYFIKEEHTAKLYKKVIED